MIRAADICIHPDQEMMEPGGEPEVNIDTSAIVTATEANQNFSKVSKMAEKKGHIVVFKNNRPKLLVIDLDTEPQIEMTEDEKIDFVAARILREHKAAFEELAK